MSNELLPVIVSPSLLNYFLCIKGHETPAKGGDFVTSCRHKMGKTKKMCRARILKISRTEYFCALPGCKKTSTNKAPSWSRLSIGFARDDGSGGAMQNRHVENVRFCCDGHCHEYLKRIAKEVYKW